MPNKKDYFNIDTYDNSETFYDYVQQVNINLSDADFKHIAYESNTYRIVWRTAYDVEHKHLLNINITESNWITNINNKYFFKQQSGGVEIHSIKERYRHLIATDESLMSIAIKTDDIKVFKYLISLITDSSQIDSDVVTKWYLNALTVYNYEMIHILEQKFNIDKYADRYVNHVLFNMFRTLDVCIKQPELRDELCPTLDAYTSLMPYLDPRYEYFSAEMLINGDKIKIYDKKYMYHYAMISKTHFLNNYEYINEYHIDIFKNIMEGIDYYHYCDYESKITKEGMLLLTFIEDIFDKCFDAQQHEAIEIFTKKLMSYEKIEIGRQYNKGVSLAFFEQYIKHNVFDVIDDYEYLIVLYSYLITHGLDKCVTEDNLKKLSDKWQTIERWSFNHYNRIIAWLHYIYSFGYPISKNKYMQQIAYHVIKIYLNSFHFARNIGHLYHGLGKFGFDYSQVTPFVKEIGVLHAVFELNKDIYDDYHKHINEVTVFNAVLNDLGLNSWQRPEANK